jgi:4-hydroxymandelate oxidase
VFSGGSSRGSAGLAAAGVPVTLPRIRAAERLELEGSSATALDPRLRGFIHDLVRPYGLAVREDLLSSGAGHAFGELADPLVAALTPPEAEPLDLVVLAYSMHDIQPGRSTATYLSHLCPGAALSFSLCDQGAAAAFSALRLIQSYARAGECRRALLLVAEQSGLHYELPVPVAMPDRHAAVAVLFDDTGPAALGPVRQHTDVTPHAAPALVAAELGQLVGDRGCATTLILGTGLAGLAASLELPAAVEEVLVAPAGLPNTGAWWELAGGLAGWAARQRLVLLADYDPVLRYLSLCAADFTDVAVVAAASAARVSGGVR